MQLFQYLFRIAFITTGYTEIVTVPDKKSLAIQFFDERFVEPLIENFV
ncbi:MAG TPA: hypothetical protein VE954_19405 [Oligoflexus sp.]|nr:hypothetical protein [Oligoflexus sp.]HYX35269.1 hypothetical protein [Oligoflexus sp.]